MDRMSHRRAQTILESFNFAFEGIIHVLRTQRNMRIHFAAAVVVLVAALWAGVSHLELIALMLAIAFVFITEMINSALEQAIDVATTSFDPLAKLAKDIAAGAVLIASVNAIAVGYLVFSHAIGQSAGSFLERLRDLPTEVTLIALVLTVLVVIATKAFVGRGTPRGPGDSAVHSTDLRVTGITCVAGRKVALRCARFSYGRSGACFAAGSWWRCRSTKPPGSQSVERCTSRRRSMSIRWLD